MRRCLAAAAAARAASRTTRAVGWAPVSVSRVRVGAGQHLEVGQRMTCGCSLASRPGSRSSSGFPSAVATQSVQTGRPALGFSEIAHACVPFVDLRPDDNHMAVLEQHPPM